MATQGCDHEDGAMTPEPGTGQQGFPTADPRKIEQIFADTEHLARLGAWEWEFPSGKVYWSAGIFYVFGLTRETFDGTFATLLALAHPEDRAKVLHSKEQALLHGTPFEIEYRIIRPDGGLRYLMCRGGVFQDGSTECRRIVGVSQDITERKALEEQLRSQFEQLKELDRLKSIFVSTVSHEIRTPLTSIKGYSEFLEEGLGGPLSPEQDQFVRHIQEGTLRLERLVNDLVDFARLDAGTFKLKPERVEIGAKIRQVCGSFRPQLDESGQTLRLELPPEPLLVWADAQRIEQVVANLVGNAIKFTPEGGVIQVSLSADEREARCEVRDSGQGIAEEDLPKLFHRFAQLESGVRKGGMGLGLSISKAIVEAHGGTIGVLSQEGSGSTFWFTLPLEGQ